MQDRLLALEEAATHHARILDDLSAQMNEQWQAIARLERDVALILDHLRAAEAEAGDGASAPPPHF